MARDVDLGRDDSPVQSFVEEQVGVLTDVFPGSEGAWLLLVGRGLDRVVQVFARSAETGPGIGGKEFFEFCKEVVRRAEVAEVLVAGFFCLGLTQAHFLALVAVKTVAFDDCGLDVLAAKDVLEGPGDRRGAGTGGAGDGDDGMAFGHDRLVNL